MKKPEMSKDETKWTYGASKILIAFVLILPVTFMALITWMAYLNIGGIGYYLTMFFTFCMGMVIILVILAVFMIGFITRQATDKLGEDDDDEPEGDGVKYHG